MINNFSKTVNKNPQGSSLLSPAHGRVGARVTFLSFILLVPPPSEKIAGGFQQAGKKEGGLGEGIFARLLSAPKARQGWEAARSCSSRKTKPAKIVSLIEKGFCARPLKEKEIFAGFVRRQAASRWGGFLPVRAEILAQNGFAFRSVIATNLNIANFAGSLFARSPRFWRGFARIFPYISAQKQTDGQNQKSIFCPAGGGSGRQSRQSKNTPLRNSLNCFCFPFFSACRFAALRSQFFNPALFPPKAERPKATY
jgi:hypothetical protein